jgi:hypothetical protein
MQKKGLLWILALILIIVPLIIVSSKSKSFKNLLTSKNEDEVEKTEKKQNHSSNIASVKQKISKQKQRIKDNKNTENNQ